MGTNRLLNKVSDCSTALSAITDGALVSVSGFNLAATPEHLILELYGLYEQTGHPKDLFIMSDSLPAVPGRAMDAVSKALIKAKDQSFIRGIMVPFLGFAPSMQKLVTDNRVEAYGWPIGIAAYWFREVASGRPGVVTKIGLDTLLDPRRDGGALNELGRHKMTCKVELIRIEDEEYLFYQAPKPNFALLRATTADEMGNLSMEDEGIRDTVLNMAQATKARPNPGTVIAQIRWLTKSGTMNPRDVDVPGPLVDHVVLSPREHHWQSGDFEYDPRISYRVMPLLTGEGTADITPGVEHEYHKVIARRVLLQLIKILEEKGSPVLVNLGVGIPALISRLAAEEEVTEYVITVLESGPWGGLALSGVNFGLALSPFALSSVPDMFSNFEGGIIDAASLGFLQIGAGGDVNPSMLPGKIFGPGGFPVIAGGGPRIYFAGAFTAGPSNLKVGEEGLKIVQDGPTLKFVKSVYKSLFSGREATKFEKEVLYVTERAVFSLSKGRVVLEEVAPGVDLERDVLGKMEFEPQVSPKLKQMDRVLFGKEKMGLKDQIARIVKG